MIAKVLQEIGLVGGSASCLLLWLSDADNVLDSIRLVDARIRTADRQCVNLVASLFRLGRQQVLNKCIVVLDHVKSQDKVRSPDTIYVILSPSA